MQIANTIANNRFWSKHGVRTSWVLACLCLALSVSYVGWSIYSHSKTRAENLQPQAIAPLTQPTKRLYRASEITSANLFGDPAPKQVVTNAPKTTLNLTLQGVLSTSNPQFARAIITSGNTDAGLYSVGENIKGAGASVKEIRPHEVLLDRNGATESLPLVKSDLGNKKPIISFARTDARTTRADAISALQINSGQRESIRARISSANQANTQRLQGTNGKPRKVRKPNFSGLDRALKKMGEL
jgi:type II secretion system protein C